MLELRVGLHGHIARIRVPLDADLHILAHAQRGGLDEAEVGPGDVDAQRGDFHGDLRALDGGVGGGRARGQHVQVARDGAVFARVGALQVGARIHGVPGHGHVHAQLQPGNAHAAGGGRHVANGAGVVVGLDIHVGGVVRGADLQVAALHAEVRAVDVLAVGRAVHGGFGDAVEGAVADIRLHAVAAVADHIQLVEGGVAIDLGVDDRVGAAVGHGRGHLIADQAAAAGHGFGQGRALLGRLEARVTGDRQGGQLHVGARVRVVQGHHGGTRRIGLEADVQALHRSRRRGFAVAVHIQLAIHLQAVGAFEDGVVQGVVAGDGRVHGHHIRAHRRGHGVRHGGGGAAIGGHAGLHVQVAVDGHEAALGVHDGAVLRPHVGVVHAQARGVQAHRQRREAGRGGTRQVGHHVHVAAGGHIRVGQPGARRSVVEGQQHVAARGRAARRQ